MSFLSRCRTVFAILLIGISAATLLLLGASAAAYSTVAAVCAEIRAWLSSILSQTSVSVFGVLLALALPILVATVLSAYRAAAQGRLLSHLSATLLAAAILLSSYTVNLGVSTYRPLPDTDSISYGTDELYSACLVLISQINEARSGEILYKDSAILEEYMRTAAGQNADSQSLYPIKTRIKDMAIDTLFLRLGVLGMYSPITAEITVNSLIPEYAYTFTSAHELVHLYGVSNEGEATFIAYLLLSDSDDAYFRYCAALSMYEEAAGCLYHADSNMYYELSSLLCDRARRDISSLRALLQGSENSDGAYITASRLYERLSCTDGDYSDSVKLLIAYLRTQ